MSKLEASARAVMAEHSKEIARIKTDLLNFDAPAQRAINAGFSRMGVTRFPGGKDDLWEMIVAIDNGWDYQRPPAGLINRWAAY
jgi:hypothetical protein